MDQNERIILRALMSKENWTSAKGLVTPDLWRTGASKALYSLIEKLHGETADDVSPSEMRMELGSMYKSNSSRLEELLLEVGYVEKQELIDYGMLSRRVRSSVSRSKLLEAAEYIATHQHEATLDCSVPLQLVKDAAAIGARADSGVISLSDFNCAAGVDYRPGVIPTGLSDNLDDRLRGGVGAGELYVILAGTGRGKSSLLIKQAAAAALAGKKVFHVTLEINAAKTARRYQQAMTGLLPEEMVQRPDLVRAAMAQMESAGGDVEIRDWSYEGVTVDDIYSLVTNYRSAGNRVDVLVIDYLQLLRASGISGRHDPRHGYARVAQDARSTARALEIPVLTAWQTNRAGMEKELVTEIDVAESHDLSTVADIIISLNQNKLEKANNIMRLHIVKQRESSSRGTVPIFVDMDRLLVKDINVTQYGGGAGAHATVAGTTGTD